MNYDDARLISNDIGEVDGTKKVVVDCQNAVIEARDIGRTNLDILQTYGPRALCYSNDASISFVSNLNDALSVVIKNMETTTDASISLNDLNILLKNLIVKYEEKKQKEEEMQNCHDKIQSEPDEIEDGINKDGTKRKRKNDYKKWLQDEYSRMKEELEAIENEISNIQSMIDAKYTYIKSKYSSLSNLNDMLINSGENIAFDRDYGNIYGSEKLVIMTGKEIKDALKGYSLSDKNDKYREITKGFDDDTEYYIVNTKISPIDYTKYISENQLYQSRGFLGGECSKLSYRYNADMINGKYTPKTTIKDGKAEITYVNNTYKMTYARAFEVDSERNVTSYISDDGSVDEAAKQVIDIMYEEVTNGRPVALQVVIRDINSGNIINGQRHWISVVGFKADVKSSEDIKIDELVTIDCATGILGVNDRQMKAVSVSSSPIAYRIGTYDPLYAHLNINSNVKDTDDKLHEAVSKLKNEYEQGFNDYDGRNVKIIPKVNYDEDKKVEIPDANKILRFYNKYLVENDSEKLKTKK